MRRELHLALLLPLGGLLCWLLLLPCWLPGWLLGL
jgi:hypothetical protein